MQHTSRHIWTSASLLKGASPHIERTKGGLNSKRHAVCDDVGRPVHIYLTTGKMSDFRGVEVLLANLFDEAQEVIRTESNY